MRLLAVAMLLLLIAGATPWATFAAVRPPPPAANLQAWVKSTPPAQRLARHVLLVVVDGLRSDIAKEPRRMPHFSQALEVHTSGEVLAGPITMTSSAVLSYGTGQRGGLDQILENLHQPTAAFNSWLENAHQAGRRLMAVGDPAWSHLYGKWLDEFRPDPEGIAIEADFNLRTFGNARELVAKSPDFLVVHFVTPDHQGHAYGIQSPNYARHIHAFDQALFDWLRSLGSEWTVIVTSDHGAADSGTHGTDTDVQRRSPIFAYGPGIRSQLHESRLLDQVELPGLFAALLGVRTATQGRGTTLVDWLDIPPLEKRRIACGEIARLESLARELAPSDANRSESQARRCCDAAQHEQTCTSEARAMAAVYDIGLGKTQGIHSIRSWPWVALVVLAAILAALFTFAKRAFAPIALGSLWLLGSLALTYCVERLPGVAPNVVRSLMFVVVNGGLLIGCFRFNAIAPLATRYPALALSIVPGWLLVSYTTNTQIEAYVVVALVALWMLIGSGDPAKSPFEVPARLQKNVGMPLSRSAMRLFQRKMSGNSVLVVACVLLLAFPGAKPSDICPAILETPSLLAACVAGTLLTLGLWYLVRQTPGECAGARTERITVFTCVAIATALLSLILRHYSVTWLGRIAFGVTCAGASIACLKGNRRWALVLGVASYAWVSRDFEWIAFMPALLLADVASRAWSTAAHFGMPVVTSRKFAGTLVLVTYLFALGTLQRIGLQGGLQLTTLDYTAGSLGNAHIPNWLAAACLGYKFVIAQVLLLGVGLWRMPAQKQTQILLALGTAHLARGVALLLMLFTCGQSYWTAFRVIADLPFAILGVATVGLLISFDAGAFESV